jgi:hypothetical protein
VTDLKDYCPREPARSFPASLDPETLRRSDPKRFASIYPKNVKLLGGTPINPNEYILVDDEPNLRFMRHKGDFQLHVVTVELNNPVVTVARYCFCGGKALVLLQSAKPLDSLYVLPLLGRIRAVSVDGHESGYIKPGGKGTGGQGQDGNTNTVGKGQDGNTNTVGKGQGYPNCIGVTDSENELSGEGWMTQDDLKGTDPCLKIAVLDSGIRFRGGIPFRPLANSCGDKGTGWDFVGDGTTPDNDPKDEQTNQHGTRVANIIKSVCPQATILPVRISNAANACTLYDVLCGLEYAAQQGVRLINASWVFPTYQGTYIPLLQASLGRLAYRGIIVVCAAGNIGFVPPEELDTIPHIGTNNGDLFVPMLSPACSSEVLDNVITVTSVAEVPDWRDGATRGGQDGDGVPTRRTVCELRSKRFVTVGVVVNGENQEDNFGSFITPDLNDFRGTSFATPYVTGEIANAMHRRADLSSRNDVLRAINARRDPDLKKQIRGGRWIEACLPKNEHDLT